MQQADKENTATTVGAFIVNPRASRVEIADALDQRLSYLKALSIAAMEDGEDGIANCGPDIWNGVFLCMANMVDEVRALVEVTRAGRA